MIQHEDPDRFDTVSDPARTPGNGWAGEGGASHLGPATHLDSEKVEEELEHDLAEATDEQP